MTHGSIIEEHEAELIKGRKEIENLHKKIKIIQQDTSEIKYGLQERGIINNVQNDKIQEIKEEYKEGDRTLKQDIHDLRKDMREIRKESSENRKEISGIREDISELKESMAGCVAIFETNEKKENKRIAITSNKYAKAGLYLALGIGVTTLLVTFLVGVFGMNGAHVPTWFNPILIALGGM